MQAGYPSTTEIKQLKAIASGSGYIPIFFWIALAFTSISIWTSYSELASNGIARFAATFVRELVMLALNTVVYFMWRGNDTRSLVAAAAAFCVGFVTSTLLNLVSPIATASLSGYAIWLALSIFVGYRIIRGALESQ